MRAGSVATADRSTPPGWHHLVGIRRAGSVALFVDGIRVATGDGDLAGDSIVPPLETPLVLGGGPRAGLEGELAAVRIWDRALRSDDVPGLSA
jgi:hypothetical protein